MTDELIGVTGSDGAVGRAVVRRLRKHGIRNLRVGTRHPGDSSLPVEMDVVALDVNDVNGLGRFCEGCRVVVNCTGPFHRIMDKVARAAFASGADYVDPGGNELLYALLARRGATLRQSAIISAGMMPGLTGLLPRWLVLQNLARNMQLTAHICVRDYFTPAAAADFLYSLRSKDVEPLAAWRKGVRVSRALQPLIEVELPFFPGRVNAHPYITGETERLARSLELDEVRWYSIFDSGQMSKTLGRLQGNLNDEEDAAAKELSRAAEMDLFGRIPNQTLVFCLKGDRTDESIVRTLVARSNSTFELTAAVTVITVSAALTGNFRPGVYFAADVLDATTVVDYLRGSASFTSFELIDGVAATDPEADEGAL